jgi:DNA polymerase-3 subunit chi
MKDRSAVMPEIVFYQTRSGVDGALPALLEKSLARGWRVVVQTTTPERVKALDNHLWGYRPESFLPHGTKADPAPETLPVYLTCEDDDPNDAHARFFLEGAQIAPALASGARRLERAIALFSGGDEDALHAARQQWKELREAGHALVYYLQDASGRWVEKAREPKAGEPRA